MNRLKEDRAALSLWDKIKSAYKHYRQANAVEEELCIKKHDEMRLDKELTSLKHNFLTTYIIQSITDTNLADRLNQLKTVYAESSRLTASAQRTLDFAQLALREINEADSAVSSAQVFELADMVTSSKGASIISTAMTSSASSEINDASRAVDQLRLALESHHTLTNSISSPMTVEYIDLVFDLSGVDVGFDFTSALSFFSLSSASSDLNAAASQIRKLLPNLKAQLSRASQASTALSVQLKSFLHQAYQPALDHILSAGIEVTESEFKSVIDASMSGRAL